MSLQLWLRTSYGDQCHRKGPAKLEGRNFDKQGDLLIVQRSLDKHIGGLWEFPGGKVEAGEAVTDALCRELGEELGIHPLSWEPLISIEHTYPEKTVLLDVWIVRDFGGEA